MVQLVKAVLGASSPANQPRTPRPPCCSHSTSLPCRSHTAWHSLPTQTPALAERSDGPAASGPEQKSEEDSISSSRFPAGHPCQTPQLYRCLAQRVKADPGRANPAFPAIGRCHAHLRCSPRQPNRRSPRTPPPITAHAGSRVDSSPGATISRSSIAGRPLTTISAGGRHRGRPTRPGCRRRGDVPTAAAARGARIPARPRGAGGRGLGARRLIADRQRPLDRGDAGGENFPVPRGPSRRSRPVGTDDRRERTD